MSHPTSSGKSSARHQARIASIAMLACALVASACQEGVTDPASHVSGPSADAADADVCSMLIDVPSTGAYCGTNVRIIPWAPADGPWGGATFQSDAGHGQSHDIAIFFDAPVETVEITAYDPTFGGNAMFAYDETGALVGSADFPGNGTPGVLTTQVGTVSGNIAEVKLTAADADYLNYSMRVKFRGAAISIVEAKGPNDGSFLAHIPSAFRGASGDDIVTLSAKTLDPALGPTVTWDVIDWPGDEVASPVPTTIDPGLESMFRVPPIDRSRWSAPHPYVLSRTALAYEVRAVSGTLISEPKVVHQDALDAQREEYIDLDVPQRMIPARGSLGPSQYYLHGDYATAVINTDFDIQLAKLQEAWQPHQFTVNGLYRNPGHNAYHVDQGTSSGTVSASWHQYGCAADIQTYPIHPSTPAELKAAEAFWDGLVFEAHKLHFTTEQRYPNPSGQKKVPSSGVGHVHVELKCRN